MDARKTAGALPTDWTGFKTAFLEEFYPKNDISQARVELSKLKLRKGQEMKSHIAKHRNIMNRIPCLDEESRIHSFTEGLKLDFKETCIHVLGHKPITREHAYTLAQFHYDVMLEAGSFGSSGTKVPTPTASAPDPDSMDLSSITLNAIHDLTAQLNRLELNGARGKPWTEKEKKLNSENRCFSCERVGCRRNKPSCPMYQTNKPALNYPTPMSAGSVQAVTEESQDEVFPPLKYRHTLLKRKGTVNGIRGCAYSTLVRPTISLAPGW